MDNGQDITLHEAISWQKTLRNRHTELVRLQQANAKSVTQDYQGRTISTVPTYDATGLDKMINALAKEVRQLDMAIKRTNAKTTVEGYKMDESILGELSLPVNEAVKA